MVSAPASKRASTRFELPPLHLSCRSPCLPPRSRSFLCQQRRRRRSLSSASSFEGGPTLPSSLGERSDRQVRLLTPLREAMEARVRQAEGEVRREHEQGVLPG